MDSWCEVISSNKKAKFSLHQGLSVGELIDRVADKFHYPPSSIRLFFSGKELKPPTALVEKFEIGKYGNFLLHLSTTTIEIVEDVLPLTTSVGHTIDLTLPGADTVSDTLVDLTTSPSIKRKRPRLITNHESSIEDSHLLENQVSIKTLRINILRALNHRLCILENQIINPSFNSERALITVQFLVQDSGVAQRYHVRIGLYVSCNCENMKNCPCPHILFILIKVTSTIMLHSLSCDLGFQVIYRSQLSVSLSFNVQC